MEESWRKNSLIVLAIIIGVIVILLAGFKIFIDHKVFSGMSPEQKREYDEFISKKLTFAPEDISAEPFTSDTIRAAQEMRKIYAADEFLYSNMQSRFNKVRKPTEDDTYLSDWDDLTSDLPKLEPLLFAFEEIINRPDYELSVFRQQQGDLPILSAESNITAFIQYAFRFLEMKTKILVRQGIIEDALELAPLLIKASKVHRYDSLITRLIGISFRNTGTLAWFEAMRHCDDAALLRRTLARQKELARWDGAIQAGENLMLSDYIGIIRDIQRKGIKADIQGKTGEEILAECMRVQVEFMEKYVLPVQKSEVGRQNAKRNIQSFKFLVGIFGGSPRNFRELFGKAASPFVSQVLYSVAIPNTAEAYTRSRVAQARYDILMLETARRIQIIEGESPSEAVSPIKDVFANNGQIYGMADSYYSLGPDGMDQKASILYDPTNGTNSAGDIYLSSNPEKK